MHWKSVSYLFSKENLAFQPVKMGKLLNNKRYYTKHSNIKFCKIWTNLDVFDRDVYRIFCLRY